MTQKKLNPETWIWAIVQNPGHNESFLGQHDATNDIRFIPAFYDKDTALRCIGMLNTDKSIENEPQAILVEDLVNYATKNGFLIFILDKNGKILDKMPEPV
jgi:hypothetical protein